MHNKNKVTVRNWVKESGVELPEKYELYGKFSMKPSVDEPQTSISDENNVDLQTSPKAVNSKDAFSCPKCDHKSPSKYHLDLHKEGHYDCSYCGMTFFGGNGARALANHIKKHEIKKEVKKEKNGN